MVQSLVETLVAIRENAIPIVDTDIVPTKSHVVPPSQSVDYKSGYRGIRSKLQYRLGRSPCRGLYIKRMGSTESLAGL